ncbi:MAG TPA: MIP/aquaporin family protein [Flavitalea sp.]|nr:MIP/aquaporin family protein [Flavitalea sp.]
MTPLIGEFIGTAILVVLGNGVVANAVLDKTKGNNPGWIAITFGWSMAVFAGVFVASWYSKGHLNPAVTLAFAAIDKFPLKEVPGYLSAQMLGAMTGSLFVWLSYRQHFDETSNASNKLAAFCTGPALRHSTNNFATECIGTFIFVLGVMHLASPASSLGGLDALPVALLVLGIGLSFGGPTGYAINPARDLGPRIMHSILPIRGKGTSDWQYAWIPVIAPIVGALLAAVLYSFIAVPK